MFDLDVIKKAGGTDEHLSEVLGDTKLMAADPEKFPARKLLELHERRIRRAIELNLQDAQTYWAIDRALIAGAKNLQFVQAREIMDRYEKPEEAIKHMLSLGLSSMLTPWTDKEGKPVLIEGTREPKYVLNWNIFTTVYVPLVMAYKKYRWAKLFTDRNTKPLYKYSPAHPTTADQVRCEIWTERIRQMSEEMGYSDCERQSISQMLDYGFALNFPREPFYRERFVTADGTKRTIREGVRWVIPRPDRVFFDQSFPLGTVNTDTGVKWMGYWGIHRWGDVKFNRKFWNRDKVTMAGYTFLNSKTALWQIYSSLYPCQLRFPDQCLNIQDKVDREDEQYRYSKLTDDDAAVTVATMYDKVIPKDFGLFDYDEPVWMRFVYGDVGTLLYAEPIAYTPCVAYLYDWDHNRIAYQSLAVELTPFQQAIGEFLTQQMLSIKNNLPRLVFYNSDLVDQSTIDALKSTKGTTYQGVTYVGFSKTKFAYVSQGVNETFWSPVFQQINTQEIGQMIVQLLGVVERMLGYSPQEVGAPASHQQTAREVVITSANTSVRVDLTGSGVDDAIVARKRVLYEASLVYGGDQVVAEVTDPDNPDRQKAIQDMGFKSEFTTVNGKKSMVVTGGKDRLPVDSFANSREGVTRVDDSKVAITMIQLVGQALSNPAIIETITVPQVIELLNQVFMFAGLPESFRLRVSANAGQSQGQLSPQLAQMLQQEILKAVQAMSAQTEQGIQQQIVAPMQQDMKAIAAKLEAFAQQIGQLAQNQTVQGQQQQQIAAVVDKLRTIIAAAASEPANATPPAEVPIPVAG